MSDAELIILTTDLSNLQSPQLTITKKIMEIYEVLFYDWEKGDKKKNCLPKADYEDATMSAKLSLTKSYSVPIESYQIGHPCRKIWPLGFLQTSRTCQHVLFIWNMRFFTQCGNMWYKRGCRERVEDGLAEESRAGWQPEGLAGPGNPGPA